MLQRRRRGVVGLHVGLGDDDELIMRLGHVEVVHRVAEVVGSDDVGVAMAVWKTRATSDERRMEQSVDDDEGDEGEVEEMGDGVRRALRAVSGGCGEGRTARRR